MTKKYEYIEMKIPSKPEYVGLVRLTLSGVLNSVDASYEEIEDTKIAVSEAVTNAVKHAYSDNDNEITIGFAVSKEQVEIIVQDSGQSFDYETVKEEIGPYRETDSISFLREGGLGLFLIESLMDDVNVKRSEGVTISMVKYIGEGQVHKDGITN
ncbi:anti-sigma B factor RsbW [Nosocomiicoccus ampullae]|uniref:anti-sigma B factor RsbW n=1 Tax=Nosocomiicoccus ampullae TaxID=489910 RepID=UPI001C5D188C|nr:anti-sigma B factor RsbW [Nosocomiicoccus ampullae]QYA48182.1 anti-sigma B factor RsbW [Nosocomiicoccus ampullae]